MMQDKILWISINPDEEIDVRYGFNLSIAVKAKLTSFYRKHGKWRARIKIFKNVWKALKMIENYPESINNDDTAIL